MTAGRTDSLPGHVRLFLAGDVMTGRGIDQVLPHPGDPRLHEYFVKRATDYVHLTEQMNGRIPAPVGFPYIWGDALAELERWAPDLRIVNLETAITTAKRPAPKGIHYKMNPANAAVLTAAGLDCCTLANNHVMDWQRQGLLETLKTLHDAGIKWSGAGRNLAEAAAPAILPVPEGRVLVFACGTPESGVSAETAASETRPGIHFLENPNARTAETIAWQVSTLRQPGDVVVMSLHWGDNWGHDIPEAHVAFAHALIDAGGADLVFGHSSHHPRAMEVYKEKLILYGCGDFINDYEGITGHETYRSDLVLMYLPRLRLEDGTLEGLRLVPFRIRKFRLHRASQDDTEWICGVLNRVGKRFGSHLKLEPDNTLTLTRG